MKLKDAATRGRRGDRSTGTVTTGLLDENGRLRQELAALRRERDLLKQEVARVEGENVLAEAIENVSEAIVIYDADGCLVACNSNFRDLYGYSLEDVRPGVHFRELGRIDVQRGNVVVGDEFGGGDAYLDRKAEYRRRLEGSFIVHMKDGRWIKTTDRPMSRGGFVSVQVDITDIKKSEAELRAAKEAAEKAARIKSEFLANISHDLRTPLNAIIGFSDMILQEVHGPERTPAYQGYVENIYESGQLLLSIVNDLLDTTKIESGNLVIDIGTFEPVRCTRYVVTHFEPTMAKEDLQIDWSVAGNVPQQIRGDLRAMQQVLSNLVSNAAKHSDPGGCIEVNWYMSEYDHVSVRVRDAGTGMPPEILEQLGTPFLSEGSYAVQKVERGTGLGFYICTKLVEAMGGSIDVESERGVGTTVTVTLPLSID